MASGYVEAGALGLDRTIGFSGSVNNGLVFHEDGEHVLYPLGSTVVVRRMGDVGVQDFLRGHSANISCLCVSPSGRLVASGQERSLGQKADIVVWDFETRSLLHRLTLHKADIQDLSFSCDDQFLVSLGGADDNAVVVWDMADGTPICGSPASLGSSGDALCVECLHTDELRFMTGGNNTLAMWTIHMDIRKIKSEQCRLGQRSRVISCMDITHDDADVYCGTTSGDVMHVNLSTLLLRHTGPAKPLSKGISSLVITGATLMVGTGTGRVCQIRAGSLKLAAATQLSGAITSVTCDASERYALVGTAECNIYFVEARSLKAELRSSCHTGAVNDVCYPKDYSEVFATCGTSDIRLWNARTSAELVRIQVPNVECLCIAFMPDGGSLISGWSDGKIRAFGPESGSLLYVINDAHHERVTAIAATHDGQRIISGGADGQVRVWRVLASSQVMEAAMKEHRGVISSIQVAASDLECVTSSSDGSCIIWDLQSFIRTQVMFASTFFKQAKFHPDENQLLTCGTDRKVCFWDNYDGAAIRELDASPTDTVSSIDIFADGNRFVSGAVDAMLHVWDYDEGEIIATGDAHSAPIQKVVVSPDQEEIVSVSQDGGIFVWSVGSLAGVPQSALHI